MSRKLACNMLKSGEKLDAVVDRVSPISTEETKTKSRWWKEFANKIAEKRFPDKSGELAKQILETKSFQDLEGIENKAKKILSKSYCEWIALLASWIAIYRKKVIEFDVYAFEMIESGKDISALKKEIKEREASEAIWHEQRLYARQTLKHIAKLRNFDIPPTPELLKIVLRPEFSVYEEIYQAQADCVLRTYSEENPEVAAVRNLCFEFIRGAFSTAKWPHAQLICFLFEGDWVSKQTFDLLIDSAEFIRKHSMNPLVYMPVKKMLEKKRELSEATASYLENLEEAYR